MLVGTTTNPFAGVIDYNLLIDDIAKKNGFTKDQKERLRILGVKFYNGSAIAQMGEYDLQPTTGEKKDLTKGSHFQKLFEDGYAHWLLPGRWNGPGEFVKGPARPKRKHFAYMTAKAVKEFGDLFYEIFQRGRYGKYITTSRTAFRIWMKRVTADFDFLKFGESNNSDLVNLTVTIKAAKLSPKEYLKWKEEVEK